jgi:hypothetical protein
MTQANEGARRAIIEKLTTPTDTASRDAALAKAMPGQSRVVVYVRSGGEGADPASVIVRAEITRAAWAATWFVDAHGSTSGQAETLSISAAESSNRTSQCSCAFDSPTGWSWTTSRGPTALFSFRPQVLPARMVF